MPLGEKQGLQADTLASLTDLPAGPALRSVSNCVCEMLQRSCSVVLDHKMETSPCRLETLAHLSGKARKGQGGSFVKTCQQQACRAG
ncbi:hypothetical protein CB1_000237010 [Camelus ferus]|nr:hypothetical protein CB1_000237010 [Camelus ferus]